LEDELFELDDELLEVLELLELLEPLELFELLELLEGFDDELLELEDFEFEVERLLVVAWDEPDLFVYVAFELVGEPVFFRIIVV